ncbi:MAG: FtsX-like permease family protein [Kiritimatiellia bacterium]
MNMQSFVNILLGVSALAATAQTAIDTGRLARTATDLCASPHRLAGTPEGIAAGDLIVQRLKEAGIPADLIIEQPFEVTQLRLNEGDCRFEKDGVRVPLQPLRPNGLALPVTPPEGLEAETVYLGNGSAEAFRGKTVRDRIAVMDFHCGERWQDAAREGAASIIFVGSPPKADKGFYDESGAKSLYANFDLPRFFVPYETARTQGLLSGTRIRLFSRMGFQRAMGRNIFVLIPGREDGFTDEFVTLACHYDTFGPLPFAARNPGQAANAAALVEAAASLCRAPPTRSVLIAFFDNEAQQQAGQYQFHFARDAYSAEDVAGSLPRMLKDRKSERLLLESKLAVLRDPAAVLDRQSDKPAIRSARQEVLNAAELEYNRSVGELSEARREYNLLDRQVVRLRQRLHRETSGRIDPQSASVEQAALSLELAKAERLRDTQSNQALARMDAAKLAKDSLYAARKLLTAGLAPGPQTDTATRAAFDGILAGVQSGWKARHKEQFAETELLKRHQALASLLNGKKMVALIVWDIQPSVRRWTILGPNDTPEGIANLQITRWIKTFLENEGQAFPGCAGLVTDIKSAAAAGIGGRVSFVLELGTLGAVPTRQPAPAEPEPELAAFADHAAEALAFCRELIRQPELGRVRIPARLSAALVFNVPRWANIGRYDGCYVRQYDEKTKAGAPITDAPIFLQNRFFGAPAADIWGGVWASSSKAGTFPLLTTRDKGVLIQSAVIDEQGRIAAISQRHPDGKPGMAGNWEMPAWFYENINNQIVLWDVRSRIRVAGIRSAGGTVADNTVQLWDATSAGKPKRLNLSLSEDLLAAYTGRLRGYLLMQGSQLLLNADPLEPTGIGYEPEPGIVDALARSARDVWQLDESRLNNLRRHNILENALERLHARAEQLLDLAEQETDSPALARARRMASLAYSSRVYDPVRNVTNDLIKAVIILLLLAIPFSFAIERVVSGSPNVYLQILGFAICFSAVFTVLYLVHPAFRFTSFPLVVLLAFVIIILSSIVIALMWSKFEYEVRKLHGVATASHQSTRTAQGTIAAAVTLGIATMRRRPMRTALTGVTIILLTFTILFFGSFRSEDGIRLILVGPGPSRPQVEIGSAPGKSFDAQSVAMIRLLFEDAGTNYVRSWSVANEDRVLAGRLPDDSVFTANGFADLPPADLDLYPELRQALTGDVEGFAREGGILLPAALYARIPEPLRGTAPLVDFEGRRYALRGSFDPARLKAVRTLDGASFVPPDLVKVQRQLDLEYPRDPEAVKLKLDEMDLADLPTIDPESVVLIWEPRAQQTAMAAQSIVFLPKTEALARAIAAEAAILLNRRTSLAAGGEHHRALYTNRLSLGGFSKVVVPLILGGLIIFSTMLSSVSDRQKEIFTFSALGLGPRHVAALFFAEASVYAVIGGIGGYLFAHAFAKMVEALARLGWTEAPAMNHSSMNAMLTLLIVMATVLISTIYPAIKASRSANPGAQRQWRMPEPEGDQLSIDFPFTVSDYDVIGLVSFLEEHLLAHHDKSVGLFAADRVEVRHAAGRFTIGAMVWLQPFDQGVSQTFTLRTDPSEIAGIDRVHVDMRRLSGSPAIWRRSARVFIHELRAQFILWRTIPDEAAEHYYRLTTGRFMQAEGKDA